MTSKEKPVPHEPHAWRFAEGPWMKPCAFIAGVLMHTEWRLNNGQRVVIRPKRSVLLRAS